jgi:aspartyl-tRNA(Asn)/glutamyl-tRNA(Gln) amidotransferase subunit B
MNSFRAVERAIDYEAQRQYGEWQDTRAKLGDAPKQTRGWDDAAGVTRGQRSKEESSDYRYFPDPDLVPVVFSEDEVAAARASIGEKPADLRESLQSKHGLSAYDAEVVVNQGRELVDYYLAAVDVASDGKAVCNWVSQDVLRVLKESEQTIDTFGISATALGEFVAKLKAGDLPSARGRDVFDLMLDKQVSVDDAMHELGIEEVDESELESLCQALLDANPKIVDDVKGGKQQAVGALIGQAKKKNPNADPGRVRQICLDLIAKM